MLLWSLEQSSWSVYFQAVAWDDYSSISPMEKNRQILIRYFFFVCRAQRLIKFWCTQCFLQIISCSLKCCSASLYLWNVTLHVWDTSGVEPHGSPGDTGVRWLHRSPVGVICSPPPGLCKLGGQGWNNSTIVFSFCWLQLWDGVW